MLSNDYFMRIAEWYISQGGEAAMHVWYTAFLVGRGRPKEGAATPGGGIKRNFGPDRRAGAFQARNNRGGRR